jgi:hypothetical protein
MKNKKEIIFFSGLFILLVIAFIVLNIINKDPPKAIPPVIVIEKKPIEEKKDTTLTSTLLKIQPILQICKMKYEILKNQIIIFLKPKYDIFLTLDGLNFLFTLDKSSSINMSSLEVIPKNNTIRLVFIKSLFNSSIDDFLIWDYEQLFNSLVFGYQILETIDLFNFFKKTKKSALSDIYFIINNKKVEYNNIQNTLSPTLGADLFLFKNRIYLFNNILYNNILYYLNIYINSNLLSAKTSYIIDTSLLYNFNIVLRNLNNKIFSSPIFIYNCNLSILLKNLDDLIVDNILDKMTICQNLNNIFDLGNFIFNDNYIIYINDLKNIDSTIFINSLEYNPIDLVNYKIKNSDLNDNINDNNFTKFLFYKKGTKFDFNIISQFPDLLNNFDIYFVKFDLFLYFLYSRLNKFDNIFLNDDIKYYPNSDESSDFLTIILESPIDIQNIKINPIDDYNIILLEKNINYIKIKIYFKSNTPIKFADFYNIKYIEIIIN